jgi:hypothetical protein
MPRFNDEWVIDKVLVDSMSGGGCACCGFQQFLPGGTADLINAVSDIDTDQVSKEVAALQNNPWPVELRDQVWADRVRLRQYLKKSMGDHKSFWTEHGVGFMEWCRLQKTTTLMRLVQLGRKEILQHVQSKYNIHSAYGVVLDCVIDQVACFEVTKYPPDSRGIIEAEFEKVLTFDRRGGFTLPLRQKKDPESFNEEVLQTWFSQMQALGGPKLLERGPSTRTEEANENDDEEGDVDGPAAAAGSGGASSSFQSDRRLIRLLIARYWADVFQKRYIADQEKKKEEEKKEESTAETASSATAVEAGP